MKKQKILKANKHQNGTGRGVMDLVHSDKRNPKMPAKPVKKEKYGK
jgi:hypothetical protein